MKTMPCPPSLRWRARLERLAAKHWQSAVVAICKAALEAVKKETVNADAR